MRVKTRQERDRARQSYGSVLGPKREYGGYRRAKPKALHTPPMAMWYPNQAQHPAAQDYATALNENQLNNPVPILHKDVAARSAGRIVRLPAPNDRFRAWAGHMIQDSAVMHVAPDPTLTATLAAPGLFANQHMPAVWPARAEDQHGWRV